MKILFLDVDGVLNGAHTKEREPGGCIGVTQDRCERLRRVLRETKARVVVSSTWRKHAKSMVYLWNELGPDARKAYLGSTPLLGGTRGEEIAMWLRLNEHWGVKRFAIVDDDTDMDPVSDYLVKTETYVGIADEHADKLIVMLNG